MILALIESGVTIEQAVKRYSRSKITVEAVKEAIQLARRAFESSALTLQPAG
jgi:tRNA threonylcarbamoyladenosine modification (KEOPS) complex  Pcc1 subunit